MPNRHPHLEKNKKVTPKKKRIRHLDQDGCRIFEKFQTAKQVAPGSKSQKLGALSFQNNIWTNVLLKPKHKFTVLHGQCQGENRCRRSKKNEAVGRHPFA